MAKIKISQRPLQAIGDNDILPFAKMPAVPGNNPGITFAHLKAAILDGFTGGVGVEYVRTLFTDENNAQRVDFSFAYEALLTVNQTPIIRAGQVAQIQNGGAAAAHYELQQNLLVENTLDPDVWDNLQSVYKRFEVVYEVATIIHTTQDGEFVALRNMFTDSFQRTSEAKELKKQHSIDHQINFILGAGHIARITNQIVIYAIGYDFQNQQVSSRLGTIRLVELSHDSYLNTKIFS